LCTAAFGTVTIAVSAEDNLKPMQHIGKAKLDGNARRDGRNLQQLRNLGWEAMVVWECQTKAGDRELLASSGGLKN